MTTVKMGSVSVGLVLAACQRADRTMSPVRRDTPIFAGYLRWTPARVVEALLSRLPHVEVRWEHEVISPRGRTWTVPQLRTCFPADRLKAIFYGPVLEVCGRHHIGVLRRPLAFTHGAVIDLDAEMPVEMSTADLAAWLGPADVAVATFDAEGGYSEPGSA